MRSAGKCAVPQRNRHDECAALTDCALHSHVAAMQFDQFLNERQSDPRAFVRPGLSALDPMKALEHPRRAGPREFPPRYRGPAIRQRRPPAVNVTVTAPSNVNLNALERRFETTFSHMSRSTYTGSASGGHSTENRRPAFSIAERNTLAILRRDAGQVRRLIDRLHAPGLDAGEIQQRVDQLEQSERVAADGDQLLVTFVD